MFYPQIKKIYEYLPENTHDYIVINEHLHDLIITVDILNIRQYDYNILMKVLKNQMSFNMLLDIVAIDQIELDGVVERFKVEYLLLNMQDHIRLSLIHYINESDELYSVASTWPNANWMEKEINELFGIGFKSLKKTGLFLPPFKKGFPLCKDFKKLTFPEYTKREFIVEKVDNVTDLNDDFEYLSVKNLVLPTGGIPEIQCRIRGSRIEDLKIDLGNNHRGVEKEIESKNVHQVIPYLERLNFHSSSFSSFLWCRMVEDILKIDVPDRAIAIRMIFSELLRIIEHSITINNLMIELELPIKSVQFLNYREGLLKLIESYSGGRVMNNIARIGGVSKDFPFSWRHDCLQFLEKLESELARFHKEIVSSRLFKERTFCAKISPKDAISWGVTGPNLRSCGINYDIRKFTPYDFYEQVDFEVPLGIHGSVYDRYLVRVEEIFESIKIILQLLDNLPLGPVMNIQFDLGQMKDKKSELDLTYQNNIELTLTSVEKYSYCESPAGELGIFLKANHQTSPYRLKVRSPSFSNYQILEKVAIGEEVESLWAIYRSLDINLTELER